MRTELRQIGDSLQDVYTAEEEGVVVGLFGTTSTGMLCFVSASGPFISMVLGMLEVTIDSKCLSPYRYRFPPEAEAEAVGVEIELSLN